MAAPRQTTNLAFFRLILRRSSKQQLGHQRTPTPLLAYLRTIYTAFEEPSISGGLLKSALAPHRLIARSLLQVNLCQMNDFKRCLIVCQI